MEQTLDYLGGMSARWHYRKDDGEFVISELLGEKNIESAVEDFNAYPWMQWLYRTVIEKSDRKFVVVRDIEDAVLRDLLLKNEIGGILLVPIKSYGRTATMCEFFIVDPDNFNAQKIDQAMIAGFQISVMIERRASQKKLEKNFAEIKEAHDELKQAQTPRLSHSFNLIPRASSEARFLSPSLAED